MAKISNTEKNISLEVNLLNNTFLDIDLSRENFENWVPFEFSLHVEEEKYIFLSDAGATFTLYELRNCISNFQDVIDRKKNELKAERYEFYSSEGYFDIIISDPLEENLLSVEIWINIGLLTNGVSFGYNKGVRFDVQLDDFIYFTQNIKQQLNNLYKACI